MSVAIIKYNAGNIQSVLFALRRLGVTATVTDDPAMIQSSDKVIFPGVGEASSAMRYLKERKLDELIISLVQPVLGICLGMQLLCQHSEENNTGCLGVFENTMVKKFTPGDTREKVPQVGWNTISGLESKLFNGVPGGSYCYFVHSYYAAVSTYTIAESEYSQRYSSALHKNNFYGVQFHPEKSAVTGDLILHNFLSI